VPDSASLAVFLVATVALLLTPGPAVLYVVAQGIARGRRAGLVSTLGIHTGSIVHVTAATVGLSSLLVSSATAFSAVKYAGAAYLVLLGVQRLLAKGEADQGAARTPRSLWRLYRQGVVVNVLNPKTALFFLAFLPQFVDPERPVTPQLLALGLVFVGLGLVTDGAYALAAGTASERLRRSRGFLRAQRWVSGSVFLGLGVTTALSGSRSR
jgi:threonine/homoserine/homoserine lactone efflux protein